MRILREDVRQKVEEFHQQKIRYPALRADNQLCQQKNRFKSPPASPAVKH